MAFLTMVIGDNDIPAGPAGGLGRLARAPARFALTLIAMLA
jgi:hypothetical protein